MTRRREATKNGDGNKRKNGIENKPGTRDCDFTSCLKRSKEGIVIEVEASPGSSKDSIEAFNPWRKRLTVKTRAQPVKGEANEAIAGILADALGLKRGQIELRGGPTSSMKSFLASDITLEKAAEMIGAVLESRMKSQAGKK